MTDQNRQTFIGMIKHSLVTAVLVLMAGPGCQSTESLMPTAGSDGPSISDWPPESYFEVVESTLVSPPGLEVPDPDSGEFRQARPVYRVTPQFPRPLFQLGIDGEATVEVLVGQEGTVIEAVAVRASNSLFAQAAVDAIRQWQFEPATLNSEPVPAKVLQTFNFQMSEYDIRTQILEVVEAFLRTGQFERLEALGRSYMERQARTPSGTFRLRRFFDGVGAHVDRASSSEQWDEKLDLIERWRDQYPRSPIATVAYARTLNERAWDYRGGGYASTVPEGAWEPFRRTLRKEIRYLKERKTIAQSNPHYFVELLDAMGAVGGFDEAYFSTLSEGLELHPYYYDMYFSVARFLVPKWHGDAEKLESFAVASMRTLGPEEGVSVYTRIYWIAYSEFYEENLIENTHVQWEIMKTGINKILEQYPSMWNVQHFARFACLAGDKDLSRKLLEKMKAEGVEQSPRGLEESAWGDGTSFRECSAWVAQR